MQSIGADNTQSQINISGIKFYISKHKNKLVTFLHNKLPHCRLKTEEKYLKYRLETEEKY